MGLGTALPWMAGIGMEPGCVSDAFSKEPVASCSLPHSGQVGWEVGCSLLTGGWMLPFFSGFPDVIQPDRETFHPSLIYPSCFESLPCWLFLQS